MRHLTRQPDARYVRVTRPSIAQMRDLASPIGAFVREKCDVQAGYEIEGDMLHARQEIGRRQE